MKKYIAIFLLVVGTHVYSFNRDSFLEFMDSFKKDQAALKSEKQAEPIHNYFIKKPAKWRRGIFVIFREQNPKSMYALAKKLLKDRKFLELPDQHALRKLLGNFFYRAILNKFFPYKEYKSEEYSAEGKIQTYINAALYKKYTEDDDIWKLIKLLRQKEFLNEVFDEFFPIVDMKKIAKKGPSGHVLYAGIPLRSVIINEDTQVVCGLFNDAGTWQPQAYFPGDMPKSKILELIQGWANSGVIKNYDPYSLRSYNLMANSTATPAALMKMFGYVKFLDADNLVVEDALPVFNYLVAPDAGNTADIKVASSLNCRDSDRNEWMKRFEINMSRANFNVSFAEDRGNKIEGIDNPIFDFTEAVLSKMHLHFLLPMFLVKIPQTQLTDMETAVGTMTDADKNRSKGEWFATFN